MYTEMPFRLCESFSIRWSRSHVRRIALVLSVLSLCDTLRSSSQMAESRWNLCHLTIDQARVDILAVNGVSDYLGHQPAMDPYAALTVVGIFGHLLCFNPDISE